MTTNIQFEDWLEGQMQDPGFRDAMEELEPGYQVARLRIKQGLTQEELAKRVGTRQSSISRLESGKSQPSVSFLRRIAKALRARVELQLVPDNEYESALFVPPGPVGVRLSSGPRGDAIPITNWPGYECADYRWSDHTPTQAHEETFAQ